MSKTHGLSLARRVLPPALALLFTGCATHAGPAADAPVQARVLRLLPLGDSITRGSGYGNYRHPLQALLARGGSNYQFVGTSTENSSLYHGPDPEQTFTPYQPDHEGYGGFRIDQIAADTPATDDGGVTYPGLSKVLDVDKPDVVLMMLGTNDVRPFGAGVYDPGGPGYKGGSGFAADAAARLDALVTRLAQGNPKLTLIVAAATPLADPAKDAQVRAYNAYVPQIVAAHHQQGQDVRFVDMHMALTTGDLSPDGVHPDTIGYDKMARAWYGALTGKTPPPLPAAPVGRLGERNVFGPSDTVTVSNAFAGSAFKGAQLVDGTEKAFVFGDGAQERVSISGFHGPVGRLRFFDTPSYTGRTPQRVTISYSTARQTSLNPADYTPLGAFPLPAVGDAYPYQTSPAAHPASGDPAVHPAAVIGFGDLDGLAIPAGAQSVLLDFSKGGGDGDGLSEIQAFAPAPPGKSGK